MAFEIIQYDLLNSCDATIAGRIKQSLCSLGVVAISDIPNLPHLLDQYIYAARQFCELDESQKNLYAPDRDKGETEGYELGAEKFQDRLGNWHIDNKKASFYATIPNKSKNKWPREVELKTPYLALGSLIFETAKNLLRILALPNISNAIIVQVGGYGRMLHYQSDVDISSNPHWCGAHFDHGIFTGLAPALYFNDGTEVAEPTEAGLFIRAANSSKFIKLPSTDKSTLIFQVGEFGQLLANDEIKATEHLVKKAGAGIERFTFALFIDGGSQLAVKSTSSLSKDERYAKNIDTDGTVSYAKWAQASFARYHADE